jgi:hypothetical protein
MKNKIIVVIIVILLGYLFAPDMIYKAFYFKTKKELISNNKKLYNDIAFKIHSKESLDIKNDRKTLDSLYLWFHIRGLNIDEGHDPKTINEKWNDIFLYCN